MKNRYPEPTNEHKEYERLVARNARAQEFVGRKSQILSSLTQSIQLWIAYAGKMVSVFRLADMDILTWELRGKFYTKIIEKNG